MKDEIEASASADGCRCKCGTICRQTTSRPLLRGAPVTRLKARAPDGRGRAGLRIATYNINGINGRLETLLAWLAETQPDIVCLQELKAPQAKFPERQLTDAGYASVWHGQSHWNGVAILSRGSEPVLTRRGLPRDPDPSQSRYIEAAVNGLLVGCLYAPNGNPAPGPTWDYKLKWLKQFSVHARHLLNMDVPVILAGDYNIIPTERDVYNPDRWRDDALFLPEVRKPKIATGDEPKEPGEKRARPPKAAAETPGTASASGRGRKPKAAATEGGEAPKTTEDAR